MIDRISITHKVAAKYELPGGKKIKLTPQTFHQFTTMLYSEGPGHCGILDKVVHVSTPSNGLHFYIMTMLQPVLQASSLDSGKFTFYIGPGTGEKGWDKSEGASIDIEFVGQASPQKIAAYHGPTMEIKSGNIPSKFILDLESTATFGVHPENAHAVNISVNRGSHNKILSEKCVELHVLNQEGELLGIIDEKHNHKVTLPLDKQGLMIATFIRWTRDKDGSYVFQIGDPEKDGKVIMDAV